MVSLAEQTILKTKAEIQQPQSGKWILSVYQLNTGSRLPTIFWKKIGVFEGMAGKVYDDCCQPNPGKVKKGIFLQETEEVF